MFPLTCFVLADVPAEVLGVGDEDVKILFVVPNDLAVFTHQFLAVAVAREAYLPRLPFDAHRFAPRRASP